MIRTPETSIPENDPSVGKMLAHDVWEIPPTLPTQSHHGIPVSDMIPRLTQAEIDTGDDYVLNHEDEFPGLTLADSFLRSFGTSKLIELEGSPNVHIIYDGYTVGKDPRLTR